MHARQVLCHGLKLCATQPINSITISHCESTHLDGVFSLRQPGLHTLHVIYSCMAGLCSCTAGLKPGMVLSHLLQGLPGLLQAALQLRDLPALLVQLSLQTIALQVCRQRSACKDAVM